VAKLGNAILQFSVGNEPKRNWFLVRDILFLLVSLGFIAMEFPLVRVCGTIK
jgi:hypothetical protein